MTKKTASFSGKILGRKQNMKGKKGIELDMLGWIIIGVICLIIGVAIIILFKDKAAGAIAKILELFRFGK